MNYRIGFRNLQKKQQDQFTKLYYNTSDKNKTDEFKKLADKLKCRLLVDIDGNYTFLTIVGK